MPEALVISNNVYYVKSEFGISLRLVFGYGVIIAWNISIHSALYSHLEFKISLNTIIFSIVAWIFNIVDVIMNLEQGDSFIN